MGKCQVRFRYVEDDVVIKCKRNEVMRDIISRYGTKLGLSTNEFIFLYNGNKKNTDLTLAQINRKAKEILVNVYQKKTKDNRYKMNKLDIIKSS